jgi:hypothetical protein
VKSQSNAQQAVLLQEWLMICDNGPYAVDRKSAETGHERFFLFKWRHFEANIILCAVRWYLRYALSYRGVEELMRERGVWIDHNTAFRWVQRLGQTSAAPNEPLSAEKSDQDQKSARRVAQMQGALLDDFVLQVALQDVAQYRPKIGIDL